MRKILLSIASLLIFAGSINATNIGYSKDDIDRLNTFRLAAAISKVKQYASATPSCKLLKARPSTSQSS